MSIGGAFACCKLQVYSKDLDVFFIVLGDFSQMKYKGAFVPTTIIHTTLGVQCHSIC